MAIIEKVDNASVIAQYLQERYPAHSFSVAPLMYIHMCAVIIDGERAFNITDEFLAEADLEMILTTCEREVKRWIEPHLIIGDGVWQ